MLQLAQTSTPAKALGSERGNVRGPRGGLQAGLAVCSGAAGVQWRGETKLHALGENSALRCVKLCLDAAEHWYSVAYFFGINGLFYEH